MRREIRSILFEARNSTESSIGALSTCCTSHICPLALQDFCAILQDRENMCKHHNLRDDHTIVSYRKRNLLFHNKTHNDAAKL